MAPVSLPHFTVTVSSILLSSVIGLAVSERTVITAASYKLERSLLDGYSKAAIPGKHPFNIFTDLTLYQLLELNFRLQMIKVLIWETTYWTDENLQWRPEDYANITSIRLLDTDIWTPDLVISESISEEESGVNPIGLLVTYDGTVLWMRPKILTSACSINVLYFPNDRQECHFTIGTWYYTSDAIKIGFGDPEAGTEQSSDLRLTKVHDEWNINELTGKMIEKPYPPWGNYSELAYKLKLSRKPLFYHINFILPTIVIGLLGTCMFFIPITSGEKVSFGITLLLALTVNQLIVSEKLPVTSENLPFLCIYFLCTILLNSFAICACLVVYNIHTHASPYPVPTSIRFLCFKVLDPIISFHFCVFVSHVRRLCSKCCYKIFCCYCCCFSREKSPDEEQRAMVQRLKPGSKWRVVRKAMIQGRLQQKYWTPQGYIGPSCMQNGGERVANGRPGFDSKHMLSSLKDVVEQMEKNKEDWMRVATVIDKTMGIVYLLVIVLADGVLMYTLTYRAFIL